ncbi:hypothetical protein FWK35_00001709, partial [Aphis craccivora]
MKNLVLNFQLLDTYTNIFRHFKKKFSEKLKISVVY